MNKDYYKILEISRKATLREIKRAYRSLALKYHPDRVPKDLKEDAERIFKEISEAYQVLSNPDKKILYDGKKEANVNQGTAFKDEHFAKDFSKSKDFQYAYNQSLWSTVWSNFEIDSKSKFWALVLSAGYVVCGIVKAGIPGLFFMLSQLIFPLACIFFGEEIGSYTGWFRVSITSPTPGPFIIFIGWVILL